MSIHVVSEKTAELLQEMECVKEQNTHWRMRYALLFIVTGLLGGIIWYMIHPSLLQIESREHGGHCTPGRFGANCKFSMSTIYYEHDVYANDEAVKATDSKLQGWSPEYDFYEFVVQDASINVSTIVEVGVWKGLSAIHLAKALHLHVGGGTLIAVDTWLGALEFWTRRRTDGKPDPTRDLFFKNGYPQVYYHFLSNVIKSGFQDYIIPFPATSRMAYKFLIEKGVRADIIHIVAAHEYDDAKEDIWMWWNVLENGGTLLGDDFELAWPGVVRAACEFANTRKLDLHIRGKKWWIKKLVQNHRTVLPLECSDWVIS